MHEPWFDANQYAWIPGTVLGVVGGVLGSAIGVLAPQGKCRGLVMGLIGVVMAAGVLLLIAGVAALLLKQPYGVWYGLLLPGLMIPLLLGFLLPVVRRRYQEAELRKSAARDL